MKTALVAVGLYLGSLATWFLLLIVGAIAAGKSRSGAEMAMLFILGLELLALAASGVYVVRRMRLQQVSLGLRVLATLGWFALTCATMMALFVTTALIFNR
jgi:hypothetical protein